MKELKKYNILMCSMPGGDRGPGFSYKHHVNSLNSDNLDRFFVDSIHNIASEEQVGKFDVFWFYAKGFDPRLYYYLKSKWSDKKFVFGQNILLDKPDIGASDQWDEWFLSSVDFDLYLDQVKFYNEHVKKFIRKELRHKADYLDKCIVFDISEEDIKNKKVEYDCLLYSKKRRYDDNYYEFQQKLYSLLDQNNISYKEVVYGQYQRSEYFEELAKSKCCVNMSLDECPGIATYEAMHMDTPIIGSPHNTPSIFDENFWVHNTDRMTEKYLKRNDNAAELYVEKIKEFLNGDLAVKKSPREFVLKHTSYERYANDAYDLLLKYCGD